MMFFYINNFVIYSLKIYLNIFVGNILLDQLGMIIPLPEVCIVVCNSVVFNSMHTVVQ